MMKVFISQPMAGRTQVDILKERAKLVAHAVGLYPDAYIIDSYQPDYALQEFASPDNSRASLRYLAESINMLADADVAIFPENWSRYRGCVIEHECARLYGIPITEYKPCYKGIAMEE